MIKAILKPIGQAAGRMKIELIPEDREDKELIRRFIREKGLWEDEPQRIEVSINFPSQIKNRGLKLELTF